MKRTILMSLASLALLASPVVFAQGGGNTGGPGQDQAAPAKPATAEEKAAAKAERRAKGASMGSKTEVTAKPKKKATTAESDAARAKRMAAGKDISKDPSGRVPDAPTSK